MNDFCEEYIVRYSEADRNDHLKLRALFDYSQETAARHTRKYGLDTIQIHAQNHAWILSRIKYRILSYPKIRDVITVRTYPCGFDRIFALREYRFMNQDGTPFAMASSSWLFMDIGKMKILHVQELLAGKLPDNHDEKPLFPNLGKLPVTVENPEWQARYEIHETMLDINNHLNNAEYAGMVQDFLGRDRTASELQINFQTSVPPDSVLEVKGHMDESGHFLLLGYLEDRIAFQACGECRDFSAD